MKKYILCFVLLCAAFFLYAQEFDFDSISDDGFGSDGFGTDWLREEAGDIVLPTPTIAEEEAAAAEAAAKETVDPVLMEAAVADTKAAIAEKKEAAKPKGFLGYMRLFGKKVANYMNDPKINTRHNESRRAFEIALADVEAGFANNLLGVGDIFQKNVVVDLDKYADRIPEDGFIGFNIVPNVSAVDLKFNAKKKDWGFGISPVNVNGNIDLKLPRSFLSLLADGNQGPNGDITDEFVLSGAVYYVFDTNSHFNVAVRGKNLRLGVGPAYYIPGLYIPKSPITYHLKTDTELSASLDGNFSVYMPTDFIGGSIDAGQILSSGGVDISLNAEYPLLTRLDVGASISRIPFVPATLSRGMTGSIQQEGAFGNIGDILRAGGIDKAFSIPEINDLYKLSDFGALPELKVTRPVRFDFYTLFRPARDDLLVIRPNIGFTLASKSSDAYFNGAAEIQLNLGTKAIPYLFTLYLNTGREEGLWRHKLGFQLNLHAFELDLEAALRSQNYKTSYQATGASVKLGLKFGW
ncbi:hypothetical protein FACS1894124_7170 [Spirochaetia bacterium]|nr:hypothetical protein FACS1894124_7170 [Spirochaetia bacterium]